MVYSRSDGKDEMGHTPQTVLTFYNYYCLHCGAQQDINIEQLYSYIIHDSNSPANSISNCIVTNQKYQKWDEMQCSRVGPMAGKDESRKKTKSKGLKGPSARPGSPI